MSGIGPCLCGPADDQKHDSQYGTRYREKTGRGFECPARGGSGAQHEQDLLQQFKQHMEVNEQPDVSSFRDAIQPMRQWFNDEYGADLVQRVNDAAAQAAG